MKSIAALLSGWGEELKALLTELEKRSALVDHKINGPDSPFIFIGPEHGWTALEGEGAVVQRRLLSDYKRFRALLLALVRDGPKATVEECEAADKAVLTVAEQNEAMWTGDVAKFFAAAKAAIGTQVAAVERAYGPSGDEVIVVPDTNALLHNPALEKWTFPDTKRILIILAPAVVGELDRLKADHRNEKVREKADRLIRQIKEYRRRGPLDGGVTLAGDYSRIRSWPTEPAVEDTLPWLDAKNADDRILASLIEIMRSQASTPVILVTRDLNLQNKAEFARLPFEEPPDPPPGRE